MYKTQFCVQKVAAHSNAKKYCKLFWGLGGLDSTEVAFMLLTQQPRVRIPVQLRFLSTA